MADDTDDTNNPSDDERREWRRVLVDLEVDYGNEDNYLFAYIRDISATGIFVCTNTPEVPGTRLNVRFTPTGTQDPLELDGEVMWVNPYRPGHSESLHPGMGIRFAKTSADQREKLAEFIKTFAYIEDPNAPEGEPTALPANHTTGDSANDNTDESAN